MTLAELIQGALNSQEANQLRPGAIFDMELRMPDGLEIKYAKIVKDEIVDYFLVLSDTDEV